MRNRSIMVTGVGVALSLVLLVQPARGDEPSIFDTNWTAPEKPPAPVTPTPPPEPVPPGPATPTPPPPAPDAATPLPSPTPALPPEPPTIVKVNIPGLPAQEKNLHLIQQIFEKEYAAKTPAAKKQLASMLLHEAEKIKRNYEARFVLLREARDIAADAGDAAGCRAALGQMDTFYAFDPLPVSVELVQKLAAQRDSDDAALATWTLEVADTLIRREDYALAAKLGPIADFRSTRAKDPSLQSRAKQLLALTAEHTRLKPQLDTLKTTPDDPAANLAVGRFYCFTAGNWDKGLPLLAKSSDARLKDVATKDLAHPTDPSAQAILAGLWWETAKANPAAETKLKQRACEWYEKALPGLSDLEKVLAEKRLGELTSANASKPPPADQGPQVIDLLKLIEPKRDVASGDWRLEQGILEGRATGLIRIPYAPPAEYDFRIVYTRTLGNADVAQICCANGHDFAWTVGGSHRYAGFTCVGGLYPGKNPTTVDLKDQIIVGRQYTSVVQVRRDGVRALLDGKPIASWKTDYSDMSMPDGWSLGRHGILGLCIRATTGATFQKVELTEVTGHGKPLSPEPAGNNAGPSPSAPGVNALDDGGLTPLMRAADAGDVKLIEDLIAKGADINVKDQARGSKVRYLGRTALHHAARAGQMGAVVSLLAHGADINAQDNAGHTPLKMAQLGQYQGIADYLASKGGK